ELDDVAELAGERTSARELHAYVEVLIELEEIETRDRRFGYVDLEFWRLESPLALAFFPGGDELIDDALGLADDTEISRSIAVRTGTHIGPADDDGQTAGATHFDQVERVGLLKQHAASHHHVGPGEIALAEILGVAVDQPDLPGLRQ